jgi:hypothetical protein
MKYVRFRNLTQLEQEKLKDLIEMIDENLSGTSAKTSEDMLPPVSVPLHHELSPVAQKPKEEEKEVKLNASHEETKSRSVASVTEKLNSYIFFCVYFVSRPKTDLSRKPVEQWNKRDVEQWFEENKISMDLCKLYQFEDGTQLQSYAASVSTDEKIELQCKMYSDEFAEVYKSKRLLPHQFTTFAYALRKLSSKQVKIELETKQTINHPATQKSPVAAGSQACEIL